MATDLAYQFNIERNGTSQAERLLEALKADFVHVDERTLADLLRFAQSFAQELNFINGHNQIEGDWSGFLGDSESSIEDMLAFMQSPEAFEDDPQKLAELSRPHLVLFMAFVQLIQDHSQAQLNQFTARHLEHYYRDILQFQPKSAQADQVHVLIELAKSFKGDRFLLAEGTTLDGGKDAEGNPLIYKTTADLMVNTSQISSLKSVFVNKQVDSLYSFSFNRDFIPMLQLALGESASGELSPGGDLPAAIFLNFNAPPTDNFLKRDTLRFLRFVSREMRMNFAEFRKLYQLYDNRNNDDNEWADINTELQQIAKAHSNPLTITDEKEFITNLSNASGFNPFDPNSFSTLQSVNNVYELYDELEVVLDILANTPVSNLTLYENRRDDLLGFIHDRYYNDPGNVVNNSTIEGFRAMMRQRMHIMSEWRIILELLEQSVGSNSLQLDLESPDFEGLLMDAYGQNSLTNFFNRSHPSVSDIRNYYWQVVQIEHYFGLHIEEVLYLLEGNEVVALLNKAHSQKDSYKRIFQLGNIWTNNGFDALMQAALGQPNPGDALPTIPNGHLSLEAFYTGEIAGVANVNLSTATREYIEQTLSLSVDNFRFILTAQLDQGSGPDFSAPHWQWYRIFLMLEEAERHIRNINRPSWPEQAHLMGVHAATDATELVVSAEGESYSRWETFGNLSADLASFGMLVSSPLLHLTAGRRIITFDLELDSDTINSAVIAGLTNMALTPENWPFSLWLTGEKDWVEVAYTFNFPHPSLGQNGLQFVINLGLDADPIVPLPTDHIDYGEGRATLKLLLREATAYDLFSELKFTSCDLHIRVEGLPPTQLRNDQLILKAGEPAELFGTRPRPGAKFAFSHPEIATKKLDSISLNFEWMGQPDFSDTYQNYSSSRTTESSFIANLRMHDQGHVRQFKEDPSRTSEKSIGLFPYSQTNFSLNLGSDYVLPPTQPIPDYDWKESAVLRENILDSDRYFYVELGDTDFGHDEYPGLATQKANELAIHLVNPPMNLQGQALPLIPTDYQVKPPYTPQIQNFSIDYEASERGISQTEFEGRSHLYHLHPFGYKAVTADGDHILAHYKNEGELYIGLSDLHPPVDISLLFQMAEGSADPDIETPIVFWDYLQGDSWYRLEDKGKILSDTTNGLLNSGIIRLRIPAEADTEHRLLPKGLHWLRVSAPTNSQGLSDAVAIHTQAVRAKLELAHVAEAHFEQGLAPESISKLLRRDPSIKKVIQPYPSFGGRPAEPVDRLNQRVSERLRHKNRALTAWDYERLVLEKFPQVYRAKCLPEGGGDSNELGKVDMILVPNIKGLKLFDPFEPKLPFNVLTEISSFLHSVAPPEAKIEIRNPVYIQLLIRMSVELHEAYQADTSYYLEQLQTGLLRLLAPWAYDEGAELVLAGKFYPSLVINFVEEQPYIDYVKDFRLLYGEEGDLRIASELQLQNGLTAPRPDGIWVSAKEHLLDASNDVGRGIDYMKVEIDLIVG